MKKILSIILLLILCVSAVSCSRSDVPDGMLAAHIEGEPFKLYVPDGFTPNITGGVSGAYFAPSDKLIVTARYFTPADSQMTLDAYVDHCANGYLASLEDFNLTGRYSDVLGGSDARKLTYTMKQDGESYSVIQLTTKYNGDMISLNFYGTGKALESFADKIASIVSSFVLCEKAEIVGDCVADKKTPDGMKIASSDKLEYRFYVPQSWICSSTSPVSEAYYPESERTNVNLSSYSPDNKGGTAMTLDEYVSDVRSGNAKALENIGNIESAECQVAGKRAISDTFTVELDGQRLKLRQVMLYSSTSGLFYTFTYTATDVKFDEHIADFDAMLTAFTFR